MILLERLGLAATVHEAIPLGTFPSSLTSAVSVAGRGGKAPCQYIKYARSGRVADAVREHSFCSSPTRSGSAALERVAPLFFVHLTPARWQAMNLAANFLASHGCGVAVLTEPFQNQRQNRQVTEIVIKSSPVLWFRSFASRDVRACVHVGPCAYMCARNARTSEPLIFIHIYQLDSGSSAVLERFWPEPALIDGRQAHGFAPISNILCGRYGAAALDPARRGLMRSRLGERFGVFGLGATAAPSSARRERNGGKASVFAGASGVVGTPMLERMAQTRGNPCLFDADRLPSGKARGTPPCPLSRPLTSQWRSRSRLARFGSAFVLRNMQASCAPSKNRRELDFTRRGRGKLRSAGSPAIEPGRGARDAAEMLRRMPCMGGGDSHVN